MLILKIEPLNAADKKDVMAELALTAQLLVERGMTRRFQIGEE